MMNKYYITGAFWLFIFFSVTAQFQAPSNPYYWKNKKPYTDYWQQDIHYKIDVQLDDKKDVLHGSEYISYYNNSPDTIHFLFFNLYQNAFLPNSYLTDLTNANGIKPKYGKNEKDTLGNQILSVNISGNELQKEIDNTIMKVWLDKPLVPNHSIEIQVVFKTYYGSGGDVRRRMKYFMANGKKHFNGAHWYPRLAVYDRKFKWCTDQHLNREFYGDFGTYEVSLNFPADYVVEATGVLQNRGEVLPDSLRQILDLKNYIQKRKSDTLLYKMPIQKGARKTWKYYAENVHDFAWVAGATYRLSDTVVNGVQVVALVQEPHCAGWQNAASYTQKVIQTYSRDFGNYAYPKMVVADCQDGMEYPMLTMDAGADPGYRGLLAHEVGHNWFYGMINNNETYRAMLDEGFTQFLTAWALEHIDGEHGYFEPSKNTYQKKFQKPTKVREEKVFWGYTSDAIRANDACINTHSDDFHGALGQGGGYRHVYMKTATMLYNLQYVLGDTLFQNAMKHYFKKWSFCHPYIEDFRASMIEYTKTDLNWFFDQWIDADGKHIDYAVKNVKKLDDKFNYEIILERKKEMQMPLDITITGKSGKYYNYYVPNTWFEKNTNAKVLPRWIGWGEKLHKNYTTTISLPEEIQNVEIDTTKRLADINYLNNSKKSVAKILFDSHIYNYPDRTKYLIYLRPDIGYNNYDGVKIGFHADGNYARTKHIFNLDAWLSTSLGQGLMRPVSDGNKKQFDKVSFRFSYKNPIDFLIKNGVFSTELRALDGVYLGKIQVEKIWNDNITTGIHYKVFNRHSANQLEYLYNRDFWSWDANEANINSSLNLFLNYRKNKNRWSENLYTNLRSSTLFGVNNYSYLEATNIFATSWKKIDIKTRLYARAGAGSTPKESSVYSAQANPEDMLENKYMRSVTFFSESLYSSNSLAQKMNHLHYGGGLNLRGYTGLFALQNNSSEVLYSNSGLSSSVEIGFNRLFKIKKSKLKDWIHFDSYLFADAGALGTLKLDQTNPTLKTHKILADAGLGAAITLKKFGVLQNIKPFTLRFDMPLYLSTPFPNEAGANWKFRWMLGINRSF